MPESDAPGESSDSVDGGVVVSGAVAGTVILVVIVVLCFMVMLVKKFRKKGSYNTASNTNELDIYVAFNPNPAYSAAVTPNWQSENVYDYIPLNA